MRIIIRPADAADQPAIKAIINSAHLNPFGLDWPHFLVAEDGGRVVGVGQIKPHGDSSRELASIAVVPEYQGQGIGGLIIRGLLSREGGALYLMCADDMPAYYRRFGFRAIGPGEMPAYFRRIYRLSWLLALMPGAGRLAVMRRE